MNALMQHIGGWHPGLIIVIALVIGTAIGGFLRRPLRGTIIAAGLVVLLFLLLPGQRAGWQRAWEQTGWAARASCLGTVVSTGGMWSPSEQTWNAALANINEGDSSCVAPPPSPAKTPPSAPGRATAPTAVP